MSVHERGAIHRTDESHKVTTLELFFDLVFVFALTQVTALLAADPTGRGALRGLLVLAIVWWSWTGFTWLGNLVKADEGRARLVLVVVMGALLVLALAIPEAFADAGDASLSGPLVFAGCFLAVRLLHLGLFFLVGRGDPALLATLARFAVPVVLGTTLLVAASFADGTLRTALWALALLLDYGLVWAIGSAGWQVASAGHFAERHGLVVIIALGESIVATGVGAGGLPLTWPVVVGAGLAMAVLVCLWWLYFDIVALVAERRLAAATGTERVDLARDSYSYLHFPMVAGIVFLALGLKKTLGYLGQESGSGAVALLTDGEGLHGMPLWSMYGGVAAYLLAHVAFRLRNIGSLNRQRLALAAALLLAVPLVGHLTAVVQLGLLAAALLAVVGYETVRFRVWREAIRHEEPAH
jgi:low temperature requirement protein LtrA